MSNARLKRKRLARFFSHNSPHYDAHAAGIAKAALRKDPTLNIRQLEYLAYPAAPSVIVTRPKPSIWDMAFGFFNFIGDVVTLKYFTRTRAAKRRKAALQRSQLRSEMQQQSLGRTLPEIRGAIHQNMRR